MRLLLSPMIILSVGTALLAESPLRQAPQASTVIDLAGALNRARSNGQQYLAAALDTAIAREERVQARAALLPTIEYNNEFIYTEGNGTEHAVFVANNGVHEYTSRALVHSETFSPTRRWEYRRAVAAEAVAKAEEEIARRGLSTTVVKDYYGVAAAQRRLANAQRTLDEARAFLDVTQKLEKGGEVARADVIKAQLQFEQRQREVQDAQLAIEQARINLAVLIFRDYDEAFSIADDLDSVTALPPLEDVERAARETSPDLRAAEGVLAEESTGVSLARSAHVPSVTFDFAYGIDANQFAIRTEGRRNLGYSAQATLNIPIWNWGTLRSRVQQAEFKRQQAQLELSLARKEFSANVNSLYREARIARAQLDSLRTSLDLATESLRLTLLRYQAGEVSVLEVVDAQNALAEARNAYDNGLARYKTAWATIQVVTGNF